MVSEHYSSGNNGIVWNSLYVHGYRERIRRDIYEHQVSDIRCELSSSMATAALEAGLHRRFFRSSLEARRLKVSKLGQALRGPCTRSAELM